MSTSELRKGEWFKMNPKAEEESKPVAYAPPAKVRHSVITPVLPCAYRVMRRYFGVERVCDEPRAGMWHECIGEFLKATDAMICATREEGNAVVNDWHSIQYFNNHQPIEDRR